MMNPETPQRKPQNTCRRHHNLSASVQILPRKALTVEEIDEKCRELHEEGKKFRAKREDASKKMQQTKEVEELKECTFKPVLIQNQEYYVPPTPFLQRQQTWVREKQEKISKKQEAKKNTELEGCSFKPKTLSGSISVLPTYRSVETTKIKGSYLEKYKKKSEPVKEARKAPKTPRVAPKKKHQQTIDKIEEPIQEPIDEPKDQAIQQANTRDQEEKGPEPVDEDLDAI